VKNDPEQTSAGCPAGTAKPSRRTPEAWPLPTLRNRYVEFIQMTGDPLHTIVRSSPKDKGTR